MFLNLTEFKKILKSAYKSSGLIVGNLAHNLILTNVAGTWGVQIGQARVPNKLKGCLVELIGDLPEEGEIYNYCPDSIQKETDLERFDFYKSWMAAKDYAAQTPFILRSKWQEYIMVQIHSTLLLRPVAREYIDIISIKDLDHTIENMPGRPSYMGETLYWKNDTMIYWTGISRLNEELEEKVLPNLAFLDCFEQELKLRDSGCLPFDEGE